MKSKSLIVLGLIMVTSLVFGAFQNCAESVNLPDSQNSTSSSSTDNSASSSLQISISSTTMAPSGSLLLSASGGTPPYVFSVVSGPGSIVSSEYLQAGSSEGTIVVRVTDSDGATSDIGVSVVTDNTGSCVTPWGSTIAHGATVTAFGASSVSCGSTCSSETRTCNNGTLSGSYTNQSCSVAACSAAFWVNVASTSETHAQACARVARVPATNQGFGICASGVNRPTAGTNYNLINYTYGTYGAVSTGGTDSSKTTTAGSFGTSYGDYGTNTYFTARLCYKSGQSQTIRGYDYVVAYLCQ